MTIESDVPMDRLLKALLSDDSDEVIEESGKEDWPLPPGVVEIKRESVKRAERQARKKTTAMLAWLILALSASTLCALLGYFTGTRGAKESSQTTVAAATWYGEKLQYAQRARLARALNRRDEWQQATRPLLLVTAADVPLADGVPRSLRTTLADFAKQLGEELLLTGSNLDAADMLFARAASLDSSQGEIPMIRATIARLQEKWDSANTILRPYVVDESFTAADRARAANLLAFTLYQNAQTVNDAKGRQQLLDEAAAEVRRGIELAARVDERGYAKIHVQAFLINKALGNDDEARQALAKGAEIAEAKLQDKNGSDPRLLFTLAIIAKLQDDREAALGFLKRSVAAEDRSFPTSWLASREEAFQVGGFAETEEFKDVLSNQFSDGWVPGLGAIETLIWDENLGEADESGGLPITRARAIDGFNPWFA